MKWLRQRHLAGRCCPCPAAGGSLADDVAEAASPGRSGLPMPRRRTFAPGILPCAPSEETFASQSLLRSVSYAGSRSTGNPDHKTSLKCPKQAPRPRVAFTPLARSGRSPRCVPWSWNHLAFSPPARSGRSPRCVPSGSPRLDAHSRRQGHHSTQAARYRPPGRRPAGRRPGKLSGARDGPLSAEMDGPLSAEVSPASRPRPDARARRFR